MYISEGSEMRTMTSAEARQNMASVMDADEPVLLTRRGTTSKVVIDESEYHKLKNAQLDAQFDFMMQRHGHVIKALEDR